METKVSKKRGISLIVLVIIIIIIIILAVAVILSIANNNKDGSEISLNNLSAAQKHQDKLVINEGELKYLTSKLSTEEIEWAKELGIEAGGIVLKDGENGIKIKNGTINTEDWLDSDSGDPSKTLPKELENTELIIPNNVTKIPDFTFYACDLKSIKLPNTITNIRRGAFSSTPLESIKIPDSVTSIGKEAFALCVQLKSIVIPNGITSIEENTFASSGLENVKLPNSVTSIGSGAFANCAQLKSIVIPNSVTSVGIYAFGMYNQLTSITLEKGSTLNPMMSQLGE